MLHKFVRDPFTERAELDEDALVEAVRTAVRMRDNIIDVNTFPDQIYENYQKRYRTIGLGYTGLATPWSCWGCGTTVRRPDSMWRS